MTGNAGAFLERERRVAAEKRVTELERELAELETAARVLLADDDMPNHWSDCVCSYCRANRALRALVEIP